MSLLGEIGIDFSGHWLF